MLYECYILWFKTKADFFFQESRKKKGLEIMLKYVYFKIRH